MKLFVQVKTGKKATWVERVSGSEYLVEVTARPVQGKANEAVIKALAKYLGISASRIRIVSGATSKKKIVTINK